MCNIICKPKVFKGEINKCECDSCEYNDCEYCINHVFNSFGKCIGKIYKEKKREL